MNHLTPELQKKIERDALENFKKENPHLADDEYFHKAEASMTYRACVIGATKYALLAEMLVEALKDIDNHWHNPGYEFRGSERCSACEAIAEYHRELESK